MTTTDPAEQIREWNRQHGGGYLDEDLFDQALAAADQRGREDERERIRAAVQTAPDGTISNASDLFAILDACPPTGGGRLMNPDSEWSIDDAMTHAVDSRDPDILDLSDPTNVERVAAAIARACEDHNEHCWFRSSPERGAAAIIAALREPLP